MRRASRRLLADDTDWVDRELERRSAETIAKLRELRDQHTPLSRHEDELEAQIVALGEEYQRVSELTSALRQQASDLIDGLGLNAGIPDDLHPDNWD